MAYNLTSIGDNATSVIGFIQGVDDVLMFGYLGALFLLGVAVVTFLSFMQSTNDSSKSAAATAFIIFTLGILFRALSLISDKIMFIIIVAFGFIIAVTWPRN